MTSGKVYIGMIPKFGTDEFVTLVHKLVVASGDDVHIALTRKVQYTGVDPADTTEAEKEDAGAGHGASETRL